MVTERDYYNIISTARKTGKAEGLTGKAEGLSAGIQKGLESGLKKGREEGLREGQYKIARAMKVKGLPNSMIAELTGLSEPEIDSL